MTFVTAGLAVAGLAAVAIPILIHLLWRQRRRPVEWAAMRFLIEAYRKHKRRLQVEQLILLAVRCLIVALLGFALARPILEGASVLESGANRIVYLIVDDGIASGVLDESDEPAIQRHIDEAIGIVRNLGPGDRVGLITAARPATDRLTPPTTDHASVVELLEQLEPRPTPTDLAGALNRLRSALSPLDAGGDRVVVYLLSEFRAGSAPLEESLPNALGGLERRVTLLAAPPAVAPRSNIQVASIDPARRLILPGVADGSGQVTVRLARHGAELGREVSTVRLSGEDIARTTPRTVQWKPGQTDASVEFLLSFMPQRDRETGITATIDDDSLDADNQRHAVLALRREIRVLLIDRRGFGFEPTLDRLTAGQWIRRALEPSELSPIELVNVEPAALNVADLRTSDAVILIRPDLLTDSGWTDLRRFVDRGGLLILAPPDEAIVHQWTDRLQSSLNLPWQVAREVVDHPGGLAMAHEQPVSRLLRMISSDLGELTAPIMTTRTLPIDMQQSQGEALLRFADGSPLLMQGAPGDETDVEDDSTPSDSSRAGPARGIVLYFAVAPQLGWTNLPSKPLMVPLFHEVIRQGLSLIRGDRPVQTGERPALATSAAAAGLRGPNGESIELGGTGQPTRPIPSPGVWQVVDRLGEPVGLLGVNVDAAAGRVEPQPEAAVRSWLRSAGEWSFFDAERVTASLEDDAGGAPIAAILLLVLLALIVLESILARWFSHARRTAPGAAGGGLTTTLQERIAAGQGGFG